MVAAVTYGIPRVLRPDRYPGEQLVPGLARDLERAVLLMVLGLIADGIVSLLDPRVRMSRDRAW